jgi:hypothetical protein
MKLTAFVLRAGAALLGIFAFRDPVFAASTLTANFSDLILGFRATSGTGVTENLEVDLGPVSKFYDAAPGTEFNLSGPNGLALTDLISTYGTNWSTRSDLFFGIIGGTSRGAGTSDGHAPAETIWASAPEIVAGTQSSPWARQSKFSQDTALSSIQSLYFTGGGSFTAQMATANSAVSAVVNFDGTPQTSGSWSSEDLAAPASSFSIFRPTIDIAASSIGTQGSLLDGTSYAVLDLYEIEPNNTDTSMDSTLIGAFGLNANGNLVFSTDPAVFAAPEPGSVALLGCGLVMAFGRRCRSAQFLAIRS